MMGELLSWWLALELVGLAGIPVTVAVLGNLPDRGWTLAKPLALILAGWLVWLPLVVFSGLPYSATWIVATYIVFLAGNVALLRMERVRARILDVWRQQRAVLLANELVFICAYALMAWLRSFTPAVVDTEKFMDVAFLSSLWRAPHLPPPDPWLSGEPINYYYFGHFLLASIAKVLGTQPGTAFNIGVAAIFALTTVAVFGVALNIVAAAQHGRSLALPIVGGLVAVMLTLVLGNLNGAQVWWQQATALVAQGGHILQNPWAWWTHRDLWVQYQWFTPSRVIPNTINEFPAFSFVLADLHAHVLALPFDTLALGVALNLLLGRGMGMRPFGSGWLRWLSLLVFAVILGGLYAINGWDLPTYLGMVLLCVGIQQLFAHGARLSWPFAFDVAISAVLLGALAVVVYAPFYLSFVSPAEGIALVPPADRSQPGYELAIFGLPLFIVVTFALWRFLPWAGNTLAGREEDRTLWEPEDAAAASRDRRRVRVVGMLITGGVLLVLLVATVLTSTNSGWTLFWSVVVIGICAVLVLERLGSHPEQTAKKDAPFVRPEIFVWCLTGTAAALVAAGELVYLRDIFGIRMNTVFKLYYQAWLLLGISAAAALMWLAPRLWAQVSAFSWPFVSRAGSATPLPAAAGHMEMVQSAAVSHGTHDAQRGQITDLLTEADAVQRAGTPGLRVMHWMRSGMVLLWLVMLLVLTGAAAVYPILATAARTDNFSLPQGLDGTAYMATDPIDVPAGCNGYVGAGSNHNDNQAIAWLNRHITGEAVILEAPGCEWTHYSRISSFTGLPTLLGWPGGHEGEWRMNWVVKYHAENIFNERLTAINTIYTSSNQQTVMALLRQYNVRFIYVGYAERALYPNANLDRFGAFLPIIYRHGGITIYAVPQGAE